MTGVGEPCKVQDEFNSSPANVRDRVRQTSAVALILRGEAGVTDDVNHRRVGVDKNRQRDLAAAFARGDLANSVAQVATLAETARRP